MGADGSRPAEVDAEELAEKQREILRMDQVVRNKVRSGVQYNMKIILRGERGSGKTSLWKRFQGLSVEDNYQPTAEIQSATINWSFKNNEDHIKVEVWDVVDKAIKNKTLTKAEASGSASYGKNKIEYLDASVVDVYKDSHAVIFLINPLAAKSLTYVQEKLKEVPPHLSVLLLLNFKDLVPEKDFMLTMSRRKREDMATFDDVLQLCETVRMQRRKHRMENKIDHDYASHHCDVYAFEASLLNCFGLQQLHRYLDIPFLQLKTKALREQHRVAMSDLLEADKFLQESIHQSNYTDFEQKHEARKQKAIERDFSVLESAGSHKGKAADNSSAEDSSSSSEEEVYIRNGKEKRRKKLKKKSSKRNEDEKDELAMSLSSQQVPPESKRVEKEMTVLKLDHGESQPSGGKRTNSTSAKQSKREEALLVLETSPASKKKNQFEADVDSFQPNSQNPQESLEGFLELSDEEEKRIYAHKQNIKAYAKKVEKQQSESENSDAEWSRRNGNKSSTSMKQSTPHSSDSDDYNRKLSQSSLTEKKMGAGKLVKRSKRKEEPVPISVVQPPGIVKERSPAIQITAPTATTKAVPVEIIKPSHTEMKRESSKSKKSSSQTPKTSVPSSDEDLPAVLKYGSTTNLDDSEEEAAQVSKLSKPMKMKKVGKTSNNIPKEIDL